MNPAPHGRKTLKRRRVRLVARLRDYSVDDTPLPSPTTTRPPHAVIEADAECNTVTVTDYMSPSNPLPQQFVADMVFGPGSTNLMVYEDVVESTIAEVLRGGLVDGDAVCFLAYGQTGSGKTHTIFGESREAGLIQLTIHYLLSTFAAATRASSNGSSSVPSSPVSETAAMRYIDTSFVEIYEDRLYDLLDDGAHRRVRRHPSMGSRPFVQDLKCVRLHEPSDWERLCGAALAHRRTGRSIINPRSSRSHAIVTLRWSGLSIAFVDLAGSERQDSSHSPALNKESIAINKSLAALSVVLQRLAQGAQPSFRDCLLTTLLQRYLSGSSTTTFLSCLHPSVAMIAETLSTLRYAKRLVHINTFAPPEQDIANDEVADESPSDTRQQRSAAALQQQLDEARRAAMRIQEAQRRRIEELEGEVLSLRDSTTVNTSQDSLSTTMGGGGVGTIVMSTEADTSIETVRAPPTPPPLSQPLAGESSNEPSPTPRRSVVALSAERRPLANSDELRSAMLLHSWFSRRSAAVATPPSLPQAALMYDDYFADLAGSLRDVLGYLVLDDVSTAHDDAESFFAVFNVESASIIENAALLSDPDEPGDIAVAIMNLLRWGLPPLFPLHAASAEACDLGVRSLRSRLLPSQPSSPFRTGNSPLSGGGHVRYTDPLSLHAPGVLLADGIGDVEALAPRTMVQVIAAFEVSPKHTALARLRSWDCACVPRSTTTPLKPFAVLVCLDSTTSGSPTEDHLRRLLMRDLLLVEEICNHQPTPPKQRTRTPSPSRRSARSSPQRQRPSSRGVSRGSCPIPLNHASSPLKRTSVTARSSSPGRLHAVPQQRHSGKQTGDDDDPEVRRHLAATPVTAPGVVPIEAITGLRVTPVQKLTDPPPPRENISAPDRDRETTNGKRNDDGASQARRSRRPHHHRDDDLAKCECLVA